MPSLALTPPPAVQNTWQVSILSPHLTSRSHSPFAHPADAAQSLPPSSTHQQPPLRHPSRRPSGQSSRLGTRLQLHVQLLAGNCPSHVWSQAAAAATTSSLDPPGDGSCPRHKSLARFAILSDAGHQSVAVPTVVCTARRATSQLQQLLQ